MSMIEEIIFCAGVWGVILLCFGVFGAMSDLILPHWKWINDWIDTLPMIQKDENFY